MASENVGDYRTDHVCSNALELSLCRLADKFCLYPHRQFRLRTAWAFRLNETRDMTAGADR